MTGPMRAACLMPALWCVVATAPAPPTAARQSEVPPAGASGVWTVAEDAFTWGSISRDGRLLPYANTADGEIYVHDFGTGADRRVTYDAKPDGPAGEPSEGFGDDAWSVSRDGRRLAYSWRRGDRESLRLVDLSIDAPKDPLTLIPDDDIKWISPWEWSPDDRFLAVTLWRRDRAEAVAGIVSVEDGRLRILSTLEAEAASAYGRIVFSPDGGQVAYSRTGEDGDPDVFVVDLATGQETPAVVAPGPDRLIGWHDAPSALVFGTARTGRFELWTATPRESGPPALEPLMPLPDGFTADLGLTAAGELCFVRVTRASWRSRVVRFDFATGRVLDLQPDIDLPAAGGVVPADASEDGRTVIWMQPGEGGQPPRLWLHDLGRGQFAELTHPFRSVQQIAIAPRAEAVLAAGLTPSGSRSIYQLRPGSEPVPIDLSASFVRGWLPGGAALIERESSDLVPRVTFVERHPATADERVLFEGAGGWEAGMARSPTADGVLFHLSPPDLAAPSHSLRRLDLTTGLEKTLVADVPLGPITLSRSGRFILTAIDDRPVLVDTDDGMAQPIPLVDGAVPDILAWSPDDSAFIGRTEGNVWWVPLDGEPRRLSLPLDASASVTAIGESMLIATERDGPAEAIAEVLTLPLFAAGAGKQGVREVVIDGVFDDWAAAEPAEFEAGSAGAGLVLEIVSTSADDQYLYALMEVQPTVALQTLSTGRVLLLVDQDADPESGQDVLGQAGVDLRIELGRGVSAQRLTSGGTAGAPVPIEELDVLFAPRYASNRFEFRIGRPGGAAAILRLVHVVDGEVVADTRAHTIPAATVRTREAGEPESASRDPLSRSGTSTFRVVVWNVAGLSLMRRSRVGRILAALDPDVVMLDETSRRLSADDIATWLGTATGLKWQVAAGGGQGTVVAARSSVEPRFSRASFPAHVAAAMAEGSSPDVRPDYLARIQRNGVTASAATVTVGGKRILAVPVDLTCCGGPHSNSDAVRIAEAREIRRLVRSAMRAAPVDGVLLGGDFNLVGSRRPLDVLLRDLDPDGSALQPVEALNIGSRSNYTWRSPPGGTFTPGRLDWLLFSDSTLESVGAFVFDSAALSSEWLRHHRLLADDSTATSDHLPIVADFRWRQ